MMKGLLVSALLVVCVCGAQQGTLWDKKGADLRNLVSATHAIIDLNGNGFIDGEEEAGVIQAFADQVDEAYQKMKAKSSAVGYATTSFLEFTSTILHRHRVANKKDQQQTGELEAAFEQDLDGSHLQSYDQDKVHALLPELFKFHDLNGDGEISGLLEIQGMSSAKDFYNALHEVVSHERYGKSGGPSRVDVATMHKLAQRGAGTALSMLDTQGNLRPGTSLDDVTTLLGRIIVGHGFVSILSP